MTEPSSLPRRRRRTATVAAAPAPTPPTREARPKVVVSVPLPFLLDFFPLQSAGQTRLSRFYDRLREGRVSTTRCRQDGDIHWPPRIACPRCHSEELEWIDLPERGTIYAFSAVLGGAPLGMEADVPFAVGLVDLAGTPLRLFGRIEGCPWNELRIGDEVALEAYPLPDGRYFYRFRAIA
ncbi:MAG: OB-fold domain-containing protein [Thermoplasmata archaeon]